MNIGLPAMPRKWRLGILIHRNRVWMSELMGILFVSLLLGGLFSITTIILQNQLQINKYDREIAALKIEKVKLTYEHEQALEQQRIASLLCRFTRKSIPTSTIQNLAQIVHTNSRQFGYDPILLLAVIHVESVFNADALGRYRGGTLSGALGLMQIKEETAMAMAKSLKIRITRDDLFKPEINMVLGVAYLTRLISKFKSFKLGLLAYNIGPGAVMEALKQKEPLTMNYYQKVIRSYYRLKKMADQPEDKILTSCY